MHCIGREVLILTLSKQLSLQEYISWYIPRDGLMMREWPYTASSRDALGCTSLLLVVYVYSKTLSNTFSECHSQKNPSTKKDTETQSKMSKVETDEELRLTRRQGSVSATGVFQNYTYLEVLSLPVSLLGLPTLAFQWHDRYAWHRAAPLHVVFCN